MIRKPEASIYFRSYFSLLRGVLSPEKICRYARMQGFRHVGMVDINNFYGLFRFLRASRTEGLVPVVGVEVAVKGESLFTAYVEDRAGFRRINEIITGVLLTDGPHPAEGRYDPVEDLMQNGWNGLVIVSNNMRMMENLAHHNRQGLLVKLEYGEAWAGVLSRSREIGLPCGAFNTAEHISPSDYEVSRVLRAIGQNRTIDEPQGQDDRCSWRGAAGRHELERCFSAVPQAVCNAGSLAERCGADGLFSGEYFFPEYRQMSSSSAFRFLQRLCEDGIPRRFGSRTLEIEQRLEHELKIIRLKGFASYFLVVWDIVRRCPRTCGRGSAAASLVSYLLGITHVDPIKYDLYFERFLNLDRDDPPDIDVDFPWDERGKVQEYVFETYRGKAGMVANHVTLGERASLRETAKVLGMDQKEIGKLARFARLKQYGSIPSYVRELADRIKGVPRYIGTHCGGVVITPGPITEHSHLQLSAGRYPVIAWDKEGAEDAGLVKIDLLGNRSLAVLRDSIELVEMRNSRRIEWESFHPLNDRSTRKMIQRGDTIGIFYAESPATRQLLKKMNRGDFEHLVIACSIIRPAANSYINEYVDRLRLGFYEPLHPLMEAALRDTLGIMVYQEDVSRVATAVAGFSAEEADRLRKVVTKKDRDCRLHDFRRAFFRGAISRGVCPDTVEEIWKMVLSFREYSFCKAHSASFALLSYKLAYLKRHYPLEFMVSVINNGGGYYGLQTYLNECRRMGFSLLNPDINCSAFDHTAEKSAVRLGVKLLVEIPRKLLQNVLGNRTRAGVFSDCDDFIRRCRPGMAAMRVFIRSGCLDSIAGVLTRPQLVWMYVNQRTDSCLLRTPAPLEIGDYSPEMKIYDAVRTLGVFADRHPVDVFRSKIDQRLARRGMPQAILSTEMQSYIGRMVTLAGSLATAKEVQTRAGAKMVFVSFEDSCSIFETVFFPAIYNRYGTSLDGACVFLVIGRVEEDRGAVCVNVSHLEVVAPRGGCPS